MKELFLFNLMSHRVKLWATTWNIILYRDVVEYSQLVLDTPRSLGVLSFAFKKFTRTDRLGFVYNNVCYYHSLSWYKEAKIKTSEYHYEKLMRFPPAREWQWKCEIVSSRNFGIRNDINFTCCFKTVIYRLSHKIHHKKR